MIPILMLLFATGGTVYGMAEETIPFYTLLIPVMIAAGYDAVTGVAIILLGAGIGTLGSTINPFATVIAANAAGIPFTSGIVLRFVILILGWILCVAYVMRYAEKGAQGCVHVLGGRYERGQRGAFSRRQAGHRDPGIHRHTQVGPGDLWRDFCGDDLRRCRCRLVDGRDLRAVSVLSPSWLGYWRA